MLLRRTDRGSRTLLSIEGELDAETVAQARTVLDAILGDGRRDLTIDLSGLTRIDSSGVGAVVAAYKRLQDMGGMLRIRGLRGQPLAVFEMLRLHRMIER